MGARFARRYPPPLDPPILLPSRRPKNQARLTKPPRRNIIASIRGRMRWVAGFKSEPRPASDRYKWPASFWNAWPASSESARHSFASFMVNAGRSLYEVQKILGHTQVKTTQRYAHLSQGTLIEAADEVAKAVPLLIAAE